MLVSDSSSRQREGRGYDIASRQIRLPSGQYDHYVVRMHCFWRPPTDVFETDTHIVVKVEIAGMQEDDFLIEVVDHRVMVAGERLDQTPKRGYQNMEIHYGRFRTEVQTSWSIQNATIDASYEQGFLYIRIPRPRSHQVTIK